MSAAFQYSSPVNFNITQTPQPGLPPETQAAFGSLYNAMQQVIYTFMTYCGIGPLINSQWLSNVNNYNTVQAHNLRRFYVTPSEPIPFGAMVNLYLNSGVLTARLANATDYTKPADGFCSTAGGIATGAAGEIILGAGICYISGIIAGTRYYLSTTGGAVANGPAVAAGNLEQYIGIGVASGVLFCDFGSYVRH